MSDQVDTKKVVSGKGPDPADAATKAAEETVKSARRKRGRPSAAEKRAEEQARIKAMQEQLDRMFSPENWRYIVRAPADTALAVTGDPIWQLEDQEVDALASQASMAARHFVQTDPKWLSLIMLSMTVMTVYGTRASVYYRHKREEAKKRQGQIPTVTDIHER